MTTSLLLLVCLNKSTNIPQKNWKGDPKVSL